MGVPKFYRWISERYPCLSEVIKEYQIPNFDNLYLDMNGIIHTCSHPNDDDPHFRISEENIFAGICHYLDFLFKMIKPKKVFFMAVDGVAPRAKMNQQRGRRFRTAKSALAGEERAKDMGENLPTEARFDSNCITPGTEFMARLHSVLKEFIIYKISTDRLWKNVRVYLSGHETPGEGEHKIMDFIRYEKSQPGYDPNTRHCLYGLDADLIMLGLCSHELYFSLLREEVKFGKKTQKRIMSPEETTFHLLHISLLRDYLYHEFSPVKNKLSFDFDIECLIDDFVLMSFLVGNDFIPHLPQLHIHHDALPVLFRTYMDVLPHLDGYINERGTLNLGRFETFLLKLSEYDFRKFEELNDDLHYLSDRPKSKGHGDKNGNRDGDDKNKSNSDFLSGLGFSTLAVSKTAEFDSSSEEDGGEEESNSSDDCDTMERDLFNMHKSDYYRTKLEFEEVTPEVMRDQAEGYVRAIQWNLHYYYNGVVSWSWYYPHHYSPYISDVKNFRNMEMKFELGKPFLPFQQLLAVLPKLSKDLLPTAYQKLMCDSESPLIDFYPDDFATDLNGKQQEWEAIVLIPFINEKLLLKCAAMADEELTPEEKKRNSHGPHLLYTYDVQNSGKRASFLKEYPALSETHFKLETLSPDFFRLPADQIVKGLARGVVMDRVILGFPTLKSIEHTAELRNENVKVFQMISQKDNMMLTIKEHDEDDLPKVAQEIVGKVIYVGWPHLQQAFVVAVSDGQHQIQYDKSKSSSNKVVLMEKEMTADERDICNKQIETVKEHNYMRWGIFVGKVNILVHAKCLSGLRMVWRKENGLVEEKQWDGNLCNFALQMTVFNIDAFDPDSNDNKSLDIFSPGSKVFVLVHPFYGDLGTIELENPDSTLLVSVEVVAEPDLTSVIQNKERFVTEEYMPGYVAAQQLGLEPYFVSNLTGTILVQTSPKGCTYPNRVNVGLNLKFNRKNEETLGFTKKADNIWLYSKKTVRLLNAYLSEFPDFFENLFQFLKKDVIHLEDMYPNGEGKEIIDSVVKWLKSQESASAERRKCGVNRLDSGIVHEIEKVVSCHNYNSRSEKKNYSPRQLFSPFMCKGITRPDPSTRFNLFDRVVNVSHSTCVPIGLRGTIIGMSPADNDSDVMYEIVFDKEFFGGLALSCSPGKGYRLPAHSLINISHGQRMGQRHVYQSPARTTKSNNLNKATEAILKHLQSDNNIPAVQFLQRRHPQATLVTNKPFYVNEKFQVASPPQPFSSSFTEASNKQFVTPKASYVPGKVLTKKNTPSPVQPSYQDLWTQLKIAKPEVSPKIQNDSAQGQKTNDQVHGQKTNDQVHGQKTNDQVHGQKTNDQMYGQKVTVKELFQSVENQKETKSNQRLMPSANTVYRDMLLKLCVEHFHEPPLYTYHNYGTTNLCIACINLKNGLKVSSEPCEEKHQAAAAAAEKAIAMLNFGSLVQQAPRNRNNLQHEVYGRPTYPPPMFPANFQGQVLVNSCPPNRAMFPPAFDPQPLLRHPPPLRANHIPDSFVASNQGLISNMPQQRVTTVPQQSSTTSDPELFYIPGGGTARIKRQNITVPASGPNLFVPNQVLKQAVKAPFDSSGVSNSDWPDLPSKVSRQPAETDISKNQRTTTVSEVLKSQQSSSPQVEKNTPSHLQTSGMTVLTKKPPKKRIAANFQNL